MNQHYRAMLYYSRYLKNIVGSFFKGNFEIPLWDFSIGEGADIIRTLHSDAVGDPLTFLSIFTPSMFGMLAVIYSFISEELTVEGYKFLKEFKSNIMFIILISIATLVFSLIFTFNLSMNENYITLLQTLIYFGTFLIIITSLMALKRFNKLINSIINKNIKIKELENI